MNGNRYYLMMTDHIETKVIYTDKEYEMFLIEYAKNNKNSKNQYVFGNLSIMNNTFGSRVVKYNVYKKITKAYDLDVIDKFLTEQVENQNELKERYKSEVDGGTGKVYIGYMYNGQAKTLPIFYKQDKQYVNYDSLRKLMLDKILDKNFLSNIWTNPKLNNAEYRKKIALHLEQIQIEYGRYVINRMVDTSGIKSAVSSFVKAWCTKDGQINQRYVRELGSIVKNIVDKKEEKKEEVKKGKIVVKGKTEEDKPKTRRRKRNDTENMEPLF